MESPSTHVVLEDSTRRARAKERLYVVCQTAGWGTFLALQLIFALVFSPKRPTTLSAQLNITSLCVMIATLGWLITHYSRRFLVGWGWKELGWRQLLPRILAVSAVQSLLWNGVGFSFQHLVLREKWPSEFHPAAVIFLYWIQSIPLLAGWLCIYFFYHLFDRLNRSEIERLRLATTVKESELRALKSQVNPHFIFNSLNSLRALIDEDPERARQSVTQLSNLLRYSLQSGQLETVPFEDELRVVNDYLALEQVRHEERLRVRLDVAPETLALPVPPMLLQTLVENAVKYGIATRPEGGEIAIIARCVGGALSIQVTNPGSLSASAKPARSVSTGVGLRNAADRLRLLFGERASLQLRTEAPSLVVAEAILPLTGARA